MGNKSTHGALSIVKLGYITNRETPGLSPRLTSKYRTKSDRYVICPWDILHAHSRQQESRPSHLASVHLRAAWFRCPSLGWCSLQSC